jgi:hypothetical protein
MIEALVFSVGLAAASFAAAAVLVFALVRVAAPWNDARGVERLGRPDRWCRAPRRFRRRGEPAWWPEFERAFADHVRTSAGRQS